MPRLRECIEAYIIDEPSMREKNMGNVCRRVALTFSNRQFRRHVEHSGDRNWLQIDVGVAFQMVECTRKCGLMLMRQIIKEPYHVKWICLIIALVEMLLRDYLQLMNYNH